LLIAAGKRRKKKRKNFKELYYFQPNILDCQKYAIFFLKIHMEKQVYIGDQNAHQIGQNQTLQHNNTQSEEQSRQSPIATKISTGHKALKENLVTVFWFHFDCFILTHWIILEYSKIH